MTLNTGYIIGLKMLVCSSYADVRNNMGRRKEQTKAYTRIKIYSGILLENNNKTLFTHNIKSKNIQLLCKLAKKSIMQGRHMNKFNIKNWSTKQYRN